MDSMLLKSEEKEEIMKKIRSTYKDRLMEKTEENINSIFLKSKKKKKTCKVRIL